MADKEIKVHRRVIQIIFPIIQMANTGRCRVQSAEVVRNYVFTLVVRVSVICTSASDLVDIGESYFPPIFLMIQCQRNKF